MTIAGEGQNTPEKKEGDTTNVAKAARGKIDALTDDLPVDVEFEELKGKVEQQREKTQAKMQVLEETELYQEVQKGKEILKILMEKFEKKDWKRAEKEREWNILKDLEGNIRKLEEIMHYNSELEYSDTLEDLDKITKIPETELKTEFHRYKKEYKDYVTEIKEREKRKLRAKASKIRRWMGGILKTESGSAFVRQLRIAKLDELVLEFNFRDLHTSNVEPISSLDYCDTPAGELESFLDFLKYNLPKMKKELLENK